MMRKKCDFISGRPIGRIANLLAVVAFALTTVAACGSDSEGGPAGGAGSGGAAGGGAGSGGGQNFLSCSKTCTVADDCANPILGKAFEAKNYECTAGLCTHLGCVSSDDCSSASSECVKLPGQKASTCIRTCFAPVDCVVPGLPLFDASHYACNEGFCEWKGCTSTTECAANGGDGDVCGQPAGEATPICYKKCTSPADCANPSASLHDASHYLCDDGYCRWTGCVSTADCETLSGVGKSVCQ